MKFALARFFRSVNANLIYIRCFPLFQFLKVFRLISVQFFKRWKVSDARVVIENFDRDIRLELDPRFSMGAILFWTGFHEVKEVLFLHSFLKPSHVLLDVGANQGEFSLFAAKRVSQGAVYSFEPLPSMFNRLLCNVKINSFTNVKAFEIAVGSEDGKLSLVNPQTENEGIASAYWGAGAGPEVVVKLRSLDSLWRELKWPHVDLIKLDIEGGELFALRGARELLTSLRPTILIEINSTRYAAAGYSVTDVNDLLKELGYEAFVITKSGQLVNAGQMPDFDNLVYRPK